MTQAILLIGPTGAGKTPLGELLDGRGLGGRRCLHFDFGAELRRAAQTPAQNAVRPSPSAARPADTPSTPTPSQNGSPSGLPFSGVSSVTCVGGVGGPLTPDEVAYLRHILQTNALLEDKDFPLAAKILQSFLAARGAAPADLLILNGLPRHPGQARDLAALVDVRAVVELSVEPDAVLARIRADINGDRAGRGDDSPADVANKLRIYAARTAPLLEHYRSAGVAVHRIQVGPATTAGQALQLLEHAMRQSSVVCPPQGTRPVTDSIS